MIPKDRNPRPVELPSRRDLLLFLTQCSLCSACLRTLCDGFLPRGVRAINCYNKHCKVCSGVRNSLDILAKEAVSKIEKMGYEWESFRIDVRIPIPNWAQSEPFLTIFSFLKNEFKKELKKEVGTIIEESTGKIVDIFAPDIIVTFDSYGKIYLNSSPLFIEGKYEKLVRWISQTKWSCNNCYEAGCIECDGKGRYFCTSVEELITTPIKVLFGTTSIRFHAGGREDVDVLVLPAGRPFVIEIINPLKRKINLHKIEDYINFYTKDLVRVKMISYTTQLRKAELKRLAETSFKSYSGIVKFSRAINRRTLNLASKKLQGVIIKQRTPFRVMKRRSDRIRYKKIQQIKLRPISNCSANFQIVCQGGTYVKEFISGDDGKTTPSLSEILRAQCRCVELDLMDVYLQNDEV